MREIAGIAAAPAANCRKLRRGSFIDASLGGAGAERSDARILFLIDDAAPADGILTACRWDFGMSRRRLPQL
jgi:hypothetical protein